MNAVPNQEIVNDTAKLIMHRLIARALARNPPLVERAKASHAKASERFPGRSFVHDWNRLLILPLHELRYQLTSRDSAMGRLRLSSPFVVADGFDFTEPGIRRRIWAAARRLAARAAHHARRQEVLLPPTLV